MSKTILVTGATSGIGLELVKSLLSLKHKVIIASRNLTKVNETVAELSKTYESTLMVGMKLDVSSLASVAAFAKEFKEKFSQLDVLVLNAGITAKDKQMSVDGYESTFATNYLGHYYLVELLKPVLKSTAKGPARIVIMGSSIHDPKDGPILEDVHGWHQPVKFDVFHAYRTSKLANAIHGNALSRQLDPKETTVVNYSPGLIAETGLLKEQGFMAAFFVNMIVLHAKISAWMGTPKPVSSYDRTIPFLTKIAVEDQYVVKTGEYYNIDAIDKTSEFASKLESQDELMKLSHELVSSKGFEF